MWHDLSFYLSLSIINPLYAFFVKQRLGDLCVVLTALDNEEVKRGARMPTISMFYGRHHSCAPYPA